jgi:hypothetical protein
MDWEGKLYCGITLDWDYGNRTVNLSMPAYVQEATLDKFQHPTPPPAPYKSNPPQYGSKVQLTDEPDNMP